MSTAAETLTPAAHRERWHPDAKGWAARYGVLALLLGGIIFITATVEEFWADRIALAGIFAIVGLSLNIILGYTGQVSLGHHAFVGLAAFVSAKVAGAPGQSFLIGLLAAAASGALSAALLGLVALRIKGLYLALITLAYGFVAVNSIFEIPAFTGGGQGLVAPRPSLFASDREYAFMVLGFLALAIYIDWRLVRSKVGRAILSLKHSESVAASYGINVTAYKLLAFVVSGTLAGVAGSLFAHRRGVVVATDFDFRLALLWVLMIVVGGLGNRTGVVIGSAFFALFEFLVSEIGFLNNFVHDVLKRSPEEFTLVIGPLLALLTIILYPGGIAEQISPITRWLRGEKFSMHPAGKKHHGGGGLKKLVGRFVRTPARHEPGSTGLPGESGDVPADQPPHDADAAPIEAGTAAEEDRPSPSGEGPTSADDNPTQPLATGSRGDG